MRRIFAALAATAVLVPVAVTTAAGSAAAATNRLTVTTISRTGAKVSTGISVVSLTRHTRYVLTSGKARALPKGWYAVLADIYTEKDGSDTLGARVVRVSGDTKTTIDARGGKPLKISLNPAVDDSPQITARICAKGEYGSAAVEAWNRPEALFLVPHTSKNLRFAYMSNWTEYSATGQHRASYLVKGSHIGLPRNLTRTVKRSSLAAVATYVRRGPAGSPSSDVAVQAPDGGCLGEMYNGVTTDEAPFKLTTYLSPGKWLLRAGTSYGSDHIGDHTAARTFTGGKSYAQTFFRSAWGPGGALPFTVGKVLRFDTGAMFVDPGFGASASFEGASKSVVTLTKGGKTLKKQNRTSWGSWDNALFSYKLKAAGWYTLTVDATRYRPGIRYPADMLSPRSTATFRFHATPRKSVVAPVFTTRLMPVALDIRNNAKPLSTTTVHLRPEHARQDTESTYTAVKVKAMTVKASFDGGKTWRGVPVKHQGGKWSALVTNPASGAVALRVKTTDAKGNSSEISVYRAYTVG